MKILAWIIGLPIALLVGMLVLGALVKTFGGPPSAKSQASDAIALCWSEQAKKSNDPVQARNIASVCERMEANAKR